MFLKILGEVVHLVFKTNLRISLILRLASNAGILIKKSVSHVTFILQGRNNV